MNSFRSCSFSIGFLHSKLLCKAVNYAFQTHVSSSRSVHSLLTSLMLDIYMAMSNAVMSFHFPCQGGQWFELHLL